MSMVSMAVDYAVKVEGSRVSQAGIIARCPVCLSLGERRPHDAKTKPWLFVHEAEIIPHTRRPSTVKILRKCASPAPGPTPLRHGEDRRAEEPQQEVLGRR